MCIRDRDKTESEFRETDENIAGDIYIGGGETEAMRLIARTAKELQYIYPQLRYHLYSGNADDVDVYKRQVQSVTTIRPFLRLFYCTSGS